MIAKILLASLATSISFVESSSFLDRRFNALQSAVSASAIDSDGNGVTFPNTAVPVVPGLYNIIFSTGTPWNWSTVSVDLYNVAVSISTLNHSLSILFYNNCNYIAFLMQNQN